MNNFGRHSRRPTAKVNRFDDPVPDDTKDEKETYDVALIPSNGINNQRTMAIINSDDEKVSITPEITYEKLYRQMRGYCHRGYDLSTMAHYMYDVIGQICWKHRVDPNGIDINDLCNLLPCKGNLFSFITREMRKNPEPIISQMLGFAMQMFGAHLPQIDVNGIVNRVTGDWFEHLVALYVIYGTLAQTNSRVDATDYVRHRVRCYAGQTCQIRLILEIDDEIESILKKKSLIVEDKVVQLPERFVGVRCYPKNAFFFLVSALCTNLNRVSARGVCNFIAVSQDNVFIWQENGEIYQGNGAKALSQQLIDYRDNNYANRRVVQVDTRQMLGFHVYLSRELEESACYLNYEGKATRFTFDDAMEILRYIYAQPELQQRHQQWLSDDDNAEIRLIDRNTGMDAKVYEMLKLHVSWAGGRMRAQLVANPVNVTQVRRFAAHCGFC